MPNPITPLITLLEHPADLNLDELLRALDDASRAYDDLRDRVRFSEYELQLELKALVELVGSIPDCAEPLDAYKLHGEDLLVTRRAARKKYNELFRIAPLRRT